MKNKYSCSQAETLPATLNQGNLSPDLKKHIKSCRECGEIAHLHHWMKDYREFSRENMDMEIEKRLPSPTDIWANAHSPKRIDPAILRKVLRPMLIPQIMSIIVATAGLLILVFSNLGGIGEFFGSFSESGGIKSMTGSFMMVLGQMLHFLKMIALPAIIIGSAGVLYFLYTIVHPEKANG